MEDIKGYTLSPVNIETAVDVNGRLKDIDIEPDTENLTYATKLRIQNILREMFYTDTEISRVDFRIYVTSEPIKNCYKFRSKGNIFTRCGYTFNFEIANNGTDEELYEQVLKIMYYSGIGHNTSKGFGMIEINKRR